MSDEQDRLRSALQAIHEELHAAPSLDADTRQLLASVLQDIHATLRSPGSSSPLEPQPHIAQLKQVLERFEDSHPTLTRLVSNMVDALGQIGI